MSEELPKIDSLIANLWMDAENFVDDIHKQRKPNRDVPEQKQAEFKAHLQKLMAAERLDELQYIINSRLCMFHAAQGQVGNGIGCLCKPELNTEDVFKRIAELKQTIREIKL